MRLISIETKWLGTIAVNVDNITSIQVGDGTVYLYLSGDNPIATHFTDIEHAADYIQRASSISLTQGD